LLEDVRLIEGLRGVQVAGAQGLNWSNWGNGEKKKILVINVYWTGKSADEESFADQVAKLILEHDLKVKEYDLLRVTIIRGYDSASLMPRFHILTSRGPRRTWPWRNCEPTSQPKG
jgi:hypothetical protein